MYRRIFDIKEKDKLSLLETQIHQSLKNTFQLMKFPRDLENNFNEVDYPERNQRYMVLGIIGIIFFNLFTIADKIMLPDIYKTAWAIRLFAITPVCLVGIVLLKTGWVQKLSDFFVSIALILLSGCIMLLLLLSNHPNVAHYHTGILIVVTYGNIIMRPRFQYAAASSLVICVMYGMTAYNVTLMNHDVITNSCLVLLGNALLTLAGNFYLRMEKRREFLYTLLRHIDSQKLEASNRLLQKLSISDELTGLANRRHFDDLYGKEWRHCMRTGAPLSLVFIDIDYFKAYNDNYGHQQGDTCLEIIAKELSKAARRPGDLVARYGGEEFVILLSDTNIESGNDIAQNVRTSIEELKIEHESSDISSFVTLSLGVASVIPSDAVEKSGLILHADRALYDAKANGRNMVCTYKDNPGH